MKIIVHVPATSANLGAGFDTLGVALSIYNKFVLTTIDEGLEITGCPVEFQNKDNLVYKSMEFIFAKAGIVPTCGFKIDFETDIPDASGLGSSATCIVAGLALANSYLKNIFTSKEILNFACEIEGHGDNVTPAVLGSLTVIMKENEKIFYKKIEISKSLKFAVLISEQKKESTEKLRKVLNNVVPLDDAVYNMSHALMTLIGFYEGDVKLIKNAMNDKLHEQHRGKLIENFDDIKKFAMENGAISVNISGAGPSLLLIYNNDFKMEVFKSFLKTLKNNWNAITCDVVKNGYWVEVEEAK